MDGPVVAAPLGLVSSTFKADNPPGSPFVLAFVLLVPV